MATISSVKIANMALDYIGADATIESLSEASPTAKICNRWYDWSRIQTLEAYNWNFARKRKVLALLETEPYDDWLYRYEYPSDCIRAREIVNPAGPSADVVPFSVVSTDDGQTTSILTDMDEASLTYTFDVTDPARFSTLFVDALAWRLASRIAFSLTGKADLMRLAMQSFQAHVAAAAGANGSEGFERGPREASWVRGRE